MKYSKPNFEHEWSEALRYREFEKMGKDGWLEKASKDFEISNFKSISNVKISNFKTFIFKKCAKTSRLKILKL